IGQPFRFGEADDQFAGEFADAAAAGANPKIIVAILGPRGDVVIAQPLCPAIKGLFTILVLDQPIPRTNPQRALVITKNSFNPQLRPEVQWERLPLSAFLAFGRRHKLQHFTSVRDEQPPLSIL